MRRIDELHLERPFAGSRMLRDFLQREGVAVGRRHAATLMRRMGIEAIYRRRNSSKPAPGHKIYPYLLRDVKVERPNQVWATDITYIPMARGFVYLVAVVDWFTRRVLSHRVSITMDAAFCVEALEEALRKYGKPEIFNTDQGSQFTGEAFTGRNSKSNSSSRPHWADPTSLEVFGRVVDRTRTLRALLIITFRPEFEAPWIGRPHVTSLLISRLAQREINVIIDLVVGNKLIPASIRKDIIERTDGIPLFVEEMTKAVLEAEGEGEARRTIAAVPSPALTVPPSLHASLMARLDRLGPAKEVAQVGAAIGREFSHALLAAVAHKPNAEVGIGARSSHCGGSAVPAGRAAACKLSVQPCAGAGCRLWHAAA